jgi:hypothetical protein
LAFKSVVILLLWLSPEIIYEILGPNLVGGLLLRVGRGLALVGTFVWQAVRLVWCVGKGLLTRQTQDLHRGLQHLFVGSLVLLVFFRGYWINDAILYAKVWTLKHFSACERTATASVAGFEICEHREMIGGFVQFDRFRQRWATSEALEGLAARIRRGYLLQL